MTRAWGCTTIIVTFALTFGCQRLPNADADITAAIRHVKHREFAKAIPLLEQSVDKQFGVCSKSDALTLIGNCYTELDELDSALEFHNRAIEADPSNYKAIVNQGVVYRQMGNYEQAERCYERALVLAPDYAELHASLGALAVFREDYDKAAT
jgi:tetratricopeptide (TPR) repeat protein